MNSATPSLPKVPATDVAADTEGNSYKAWPPFSWGTCWSGARSLVP